MMHPREVEAWNTRHPIGTLVEVQRANGSTYVARTKGPLRLWGDWELIELEGHGGGCGRLDALRVIDPIFPTR